MDEDFAFALQLSGFANNEDKGNDSHRQKELKKPLSIVDESWELIDPVPDIRELFVQFNETYFDGSLAGVEVKWSSRMTSCAGLCRYEGRGGLCCVNLSQPLLKLRPRKDLVNTLLHEMIHALLFVTNNNKDHDAHGPEFHKHMYRINKQTGSNITVYHSFHDEVNEYRTHWWKCDGPCAKRHPFYGIVRRAMNRAPSKNDKWWADHQKTCGGVFRKIKEPDKNRSKKSSKGDNEKEKGKETNHNNKGKSSVPKSKKITDFLPKSPKPSVENKINKPNNNKTNDPKRDILKNESFSNSKPSSSKVNSFQDIKNDSEDSQVFSGSSKSSSSNIHGFKMTARKNEETIINPYTGKGLKTGSSSSSRESFLKKIENDITKNRERKRTFDEANLEDNNIENKPKGNDDSEGCSQQSTKNKQRIQQKSKKVNLIDSEDKLKNKPIIQQKSKKVNFIDSGDKLRNKQRIQQKSKKVNLVDSGDKLQNNNPSFPDVICLDDTVDDNTLSTIDENILYGKVKLVQCPACPAKVLENKLNEHLDECLA